MYENMHNQGTFYIIYHFLFVLRAATLPNHTHCVIHIAPLELETCSHGYREAAFRYLQ